jgi:hypothetical protein
MRSKSVAWLCAVAALGLVGCADSEDIQGDTGILDTSVGDAEADTGTHDIGVRRDTGFANDAPDADASAVVSTEDALHIDASAAMDVGRDAPAAMDVGRDASAAMDVGRDAPAAMDVGRDAPAAMDVGRDAPAAMDVGRDAFDARDAGRDVGTDTRTDVGSDANCGARESYCGGACRACPTVGVATTMCSGPACLAASCADGYRASGGTCVAETCPAGQLYCTSACAGCPAGGTTFACRGPGVCIASTCAAGLAPSLGVCVSERWTVETIATFVETSWTEPYRLFLDRDGQPVVAFRIQTSSSLENLLAVSRRDAGGVWRGLLNTRTIAYPAEAIGAGVDASNGIYVAYESGGGLRLLRMASNGSVVANTPLGTGDDPSLAVDALGDAHVVFDTSSGFTYRRTFEGALTPATTVGGAWRSPSIAVDPDGTIHVAGHNGTAVLYTRAVAGIFAATTQVSVGSARSNGFVYSDGTTREFWYNSFLVTDPGVHYRVPIGSAPTAPERWAPSTGTTEDNVGARGPMGFAELVKGPTSYVYRSGSATAATLTETVQLVPGASIVGNAVFDSAGRFHALLTRGSTLLYLRRD